ncbi:UDP-glucuronosyltransferase 2A2-like isoform X1 [Rhopalosiphum maidis]|uniref:UDP-glucuronosyltransferase 2A2-like isoform X1 n=1 Tax=Rhopalosiphum maidis TaxID=43146 RepID=UPI000EFECDC9|nr:UDP-glucuronosyltransferase 2A2-like isoform X1 [Rhopalosiphum maidis]
MVVLIVTVISVIITVTVISPADTANILAVFPHEGFSHHLVYLPYIQELANRKHNITFISNYPIEHPNINNLSIRGSIPLRNNKENISSFENKSMNEIMQSINIIWMFNKRGKVHEAMFTVDSVMTLLNNPSKFDLLITEHFNNELFMAFAFKFNIPFILLSSCNLLPWNQHAVGQPYSLANIPITLTSLSIKMNFYERVINIISQAIQLFGFKLLCRARDEATIKRNLDIDVSLDQMILNASLIMVNTHFTMFTSKPLVPAVVEIGGIHIMPIKPLPADIQKYIDEAENGVIYFCMGSLLRGETFSAEKRQMFLNVFNKIPQRILWKWEGELPGKPSNVMIRKWMPQRDILAHPNVKLFISHGGLLGTTEAVYEGVPILSMPMFGDQITNIKTLINKGSVEMMNYNDLNEDEIFIKITSMLTNPKYRLKAKELSEAFRDRPMSPLETAVYWTEYVIRHKGAPHLRSAAVGMPWFQYYLIDVFIVIFLSVTTFFVLLYCLVFKVLLRLLNRKSKEKKS